MFLIFYNFGDNMKFKLALFASFTLFLTIRNSYCMESSYDKKALKVFKEVDEIKALMEKNVANLRPVEEILAENDEDRFERDAKEFLNKMKVLVKVMEVMEEHTAREENSVAPDKKERVKNNSLLSKLRAKNYIFKD